MNTRIGHRGESKGIWSAQGGRHGWENVQLDLYPNLYPREFFTRVIFQLPNDEPQSMISFDSLDLTHQRCRHPMSDELECDFDDASLCLWTNVDSGSRDQDDWRLYHGPTPSREHWHTGPHGDHTQNLTTAKLGWYAYMEASGVKKSGDAAELESPALEADRDYCVTFWYYQWGATVGNISFHLRSHQDTGLDYLSAANTLLHLPSYNKADRWQRARLNVPEKKDNFSIVIRATRGEDWMGDIALDDISVHKTACLYLKPKVMYKCGFHGEFCDWKVVNKEGSKETTRWQVHTGGHTDGTTATHYQQAPRQSRPLVGESANAGSNDMSYAFVYNSPDGSSFQKFAQGGADQPYLLSPKFLVCQRATLTFWFYQTQSVHIGATGTSASLNVTIVQGGNIQDIASPPEQEGKYGVLNGWNFYCAESLPYAKENDGTRDLSYQFRIQAKIFERNSFFAIDDVKITQDMTCDQLVELKDTDSSV